MQLFAIYVPWNWRTCELITHLIAVNQEDISTLSHIYTQKYGLLNNLLKHSLQIMSFIVLNLVALFLQGVPGGESRWQPGPQV